MVVDARWARRLIAGQFQQLEPRELRMFGEGWDATVWLVDERWVFRFPRRQVVIPGFERELDALPVLGPQLPLAVPHPVHRGRPADGFPWPFSGAALVPGEEAETADLTDDQRVAAARPLARFLRALHGARAGTLPADPLGRADMAMRAPRALARLDEARAAGVWEAPAHVVGLIEDARKLPAAAATAVVHGDLHGRHLLVDAEGRPSGVIDWVDLCRADPAVDLPLYWTFLPPEGRAEFAAEYGPLDDAGLLRARVLGVFLSATLAVYARSRGAADLERGAVAALERAARD